VDMLHLPIVSPIVIAIRSSVKSCRISTTGAAEFGGVNGAGFRLRILVEPKRNVLVTNPMGRSLRH
jgi:hypothetical protein